MKKIFRTVVCILLATVALGAIACKKEVYQKDINAKEAVMANALADLPKGAVCLMVGDRKHDMEGAAYHKLDAAGVLFGFGDREELSAFSPVFLAETPAALSDWLLQG